jgi:molecular chaperone GrpE
MGVQPIATVGETFDPNFHEAVAVEERDDIPANTITDELLRGYRIGNRVIRHSMVKVTTSTVAAKRTEPTQSVKPDDANKLPSDNEAVDLDPPVDVIE